MRPLCLCIGNLAVELRTRLSRLPHPGETLAPTHYDLRLCAGVGQVAVRLARLGYATHLVSRLGRDDLGDTALNLLRQAAVNTTFVRRHFNCRTSFRQVFEFPQQAACELDHDNPECTVTLEDVLAAQPLFTEAQLLVLDNSIAGSARRQALELAERFGIPVHYADVADATWLPALAEPIPTAELPAAELKRGRRANVPFLS
jgi:ribokinase